MEKPTLPHTEIQVGASSRTTKSSRGEGPLCAVAWLVSLLTSLSCVSRTVSLASLVSDSHVSLIPLWVWQLLLYVLVAVTAPATNLLLSVVSPERTLLVGSGLTTVGSLLICLCFDHRDNAIYICSFLLLGLGLPLCFLSSLKTTAKFCTGKHSTLLKVFVILATIFSHIQPFTKYTQTFSTGTQLLLQTLVPVCGLLIPACALLMKSCIEKTRGPSDVTSSNHTPLHGTAISDWFWQDTVWAWMVWLWWATGVDLSLASDGYPCSSTAVTSQQAALAVFAYWLMKGRRRSQEVDPADKTCALLFLFILCASNISSFFTRSKFDHSLNNHLLFALGTVLLLQKRRESPEDKTVLLSHHKTASLSHRRSKSQDYKDASIGKPVEAQLRFVLVDTADADSELCGYSIQLLLLQGFLFVLLAFVSMLLAHPLAAFLLVLPTVGSSCASLAALPATALVISVLAVTVALSGLLWPDLEARLTQTLCCSVTRPAQAVIASVYTTVKTSMETCPTI
ncbi:uncharacterized protein LOC101864143 [Aplysia californica]|uniref:Uncharacterized protein LOC101864143 n=1 Tax=Aplysia californica TaxID=6500 RepID=A0ABM0ZZX5_APLCA|nr:uncharacterized protein LOC101864143 [Aplysia californica]